MECERLGLDDSVQVEWRHFFSNLKGFAAAFIADSLRFLKPAGKFQNLMPACSSRSTGQPGVRKLVQSAEGNDRKTSCLVFEVH
jgi:hypothetical protein